MSTIRVDRQAEKYAEALGVEARARQEALAKERHVCCGWPKPDHHEMCRNYVPGEDTVAAEGQTSLL